MPRKNKFLRRTGYVLMVLVGLLLIGFIYLVIVGNTHPPKPADISSLQLQRSEPSPACIRLIITGSAKATAGCTNYTWKANPMNAV